MPYHQIIDMICAFQTAGVPASTYQTLIIVGSDEHAFAYWDGFDGVASTRSKMVRDDVMTFSMLT